MKFAMSALPTGERIVFLVSEEQFYDWTEDSSKVVEIEYPKKLIFIEGIDQARQQQSIQQILQPIHFSKTKQDKFYVVLGYVEIIGDVSELNGEFIYSGNYGAQLFALFKDIVEKWNMEVSPIASPSKPRVVL